MHAWGVAFAYEWLVYRASQCRVSVKNASHASLFLLEERHLSEQSVLQSEVHLVSQRIANRR